MESRNPKILQFLAAGDIVPRQEITSPLLLLLPPWYNNPSFWDNLWNELEGRKIIFCLSPDGLNEAFSVSQRLIVVFLLPILMHSVQVRFIFILSENYHSFQLMLNKEKQRERVPIDFFIHACTSFFPDWFLHNILVYPQPGFIRVTIPGKMLDKGVQSFLGITFFSFWILPEQTNFTNFQMLSQWENWLNRA